MAALAMAGMVSVWNAPAEATSITSLELAGGWVDFDGRFSRKLDRSFEQRDQRIMNDDQQGPDIFSPLTKRHRTFSLFTSGLHGAPPPSVTIDHSSLFFGVSRGDHVRAWNIGGVATGYFNPESLEFCLTWDHLFRDHPIFRLETFSHHGKGHMVNVAAIPIVTTTVLFCTGLAVLMGVWRRKGVTQRGQRVPSA